MSSSSNPLVWIRTDISDLGVQHSVLRLAGSARSCRISHGRRLPIARRAVLHHGTQPLSIDHIAVLRPRRCVARQVVAEVDQTRLSDHDVYLVDVQYGGGVALQ